MRLKLLEFFFMIQGFNVLYNGEIFTTTKWAELLCNMAVRDGLLIKINKNYYRHVRK
jgi:hypothetical protein